LRCRRTWASFTFELRRLRGKGCHLVIRVRRQPSICNLPLDRVYLPLGWRSHSNHWSGSAFVSSGSMGCIGIVGDHGISVFSMAAVVVASGTAPSANADSSAMVDIRHRGRVHPLWDLWALPWLRRLLSTICALLWTGTFRNCQFVRS
jgi:hypothetical protein